MNRTELEIEELLTGIRQDIASIMSIKPTFGLALTAAIGRTLEIDGMRFHRVDGLGEDNGNTGSHSRVFEHEGNSQRYRVTVEPIKEAQQ